MPKITRQVRDKIVEHLAEQAIADETTDKLIEDAKVVKKGEGVAHGDEERAEHLREVAEEQEKISETRETTREYKERLLGGETTEQEQEDNAAQKLEAQDAEYDDTSDVEPDDSTDDGSDSGATEDDNDDGSDDDIAAAEDEDSFSDDNAVVNETDPGSTLPGMEHDLPERTGLLAHLHEVRNETLITALRNWYQTGGKWDVTAVATFSALIGAGQVSSAAIMSAYMKTWGATAVAVPDEHITERPGVDKFEEYSRPFREYEYQAAKGLDDHEAMHLGAMRLQSLVTTDLQLAKTKSAQQIMSKTSSIKRYRRVIGSDKPCPLCLLASTQVYYHEDLMPIHPGCECDVEPLEGDDDPRDIWIPQSYLDGPSAAEGSTASTDSKDDGGQRRKRRGGNAQRADDIRYYLHKIAGQYDEAYHHDPGDTVVKNLDDLIKVHDHGEMGPVLTYAGQHFRGPADLPTRPSRVLTPMRAPAPTRAMVARAARAPRPKTKDQILDEWRAANGKGPTSVPRATDPVWKQVAEADESQPKKTVPSRKRPSPKPKRQTSILDTLPVYDEAAEAETQAMLKTAAAQRIEDHAFVKANGWDKSSVKQIQGYLSTEHKQIGEVRDWDDKRYNEAGVRRVLKAVDDMSTKYPDVHIDVIEPEDMTDQGSVIASTFQDTTNNDGTVDAIRFNSHWLNKRYANDFQDTVDYSEATGHFFPGMSDDPYYNAYVHEFGHAVDITGSLRTRSQVNDIALKLFREEYPPDGRGKFSQSTAVYQDWELNGFPKGEGARVSGYSMADGQMPGQPIPSTAPASHPFGVDPITLARKAGGTLNNVESIAQAFEDYERRGDKASDLSKAIHQAVVVNSRLPKKSPVDVMLGMRHDDRYRSYVDPIQDLHAKAKAEATQRIADAKAVAGKAQEDAQKGVTIEYVRNDNGIRKNADPSAFGQDLEPWGRYMSDTGGAPPDKLPAGWERGTVTFKRPLYIDDNDGQWKQKLSAMYQGATGKQLSEKLLADGYDGVIPRDKYGNVEVVDIRPKDQRGHTVTHTANGDEEHPLQHADDEAIYNAVKENGGITIDLAGHSPLNGYAYAPYKDTEHKVALDVFSQKDVDDYIDAHFDQLSLPGNNLGIWTQDGYAYIDISRVGSASAKTIATAQKADQLAVFDLKHFNEIETGTITDGVYTPTGKAADLHRQYREKIARADESRSGTGDPEVQGRTDLTLDEKAAKKAAAAEKKAAAAAEKAAAAEEKAAKKAIADAEKARKAEIRAESDRLAAIEKAKGFGLVQKRIKDGVEIKPVYALEKDGKTVKMAVVKDPKTKQPVVGADGKPLMKPVVDVKATWASISDDTLKENWRKAIRQSLPWAQEAGKVWYPEVNRWAKFMIGKYGEKFEDTWGIKLTPDLMAAFIASYSENNSWAGNLLGIRKFLDGTGSVTGYTKDTLKDFDIDAARKGKFRNVQTGEVYDFHAAKALRAMTNPEGGVADLRRYATDSPKPADFAANIAGDYDKATADRWVARIMLHASDYEFADGMWQASQTVNKVTDRYGYKRLSAALQAVAGEPEFAYLGNAAAVQAVPWVQVVGPMGSIGYIEDLENFASIAAETVDRANKFGDVK